MTTREESRGQVLMVRVLALGVAVVTGFGLLLTYRSFILSWLSGFSVGGVFTAGRVGILAVVGLVLVVVAVFPRFVDSFGGDDPPDMPTLRATSSALQAAAFAGLLIFGYVYLGVGGFIELVTTYWWVFPVVALAWLAYIYFQHRQNVASPSTAVDRSTRTVRRSISDRAQFVTGMLVLVFTFGAALLSGVIEGLSGVGDILLMFGGEAGYLVMTAVAYVQLGGSMPGSWIVPELAPNQWVAVSLIFGGLILMVNEQR